MTIKQFLVEISQTLEELKIEYAVSGGIAVSVYGRPRYTADLDIVIEITTREKIEELTKALLRKFKVGYLDRKTALEAYKNKGEFNLIEPEYGLKADFFIIGPDEHQKLEIQRAKNKKIGTKMIKFISPEDLIIAKLKWYRQGESERQLEDIATVLDAGGLEMKYLNSWIKKLGLEKEWEKVKELKR